MSKERIQKKIRAKISGTKDRPRLSVFRSNKHVYAQLIDDEAGKTIAAAGDMVIREGTKTERAMLVGKMIAELAKANKIGSVVFDRGGNRYAGRVKVLADAARAEGITF